MNRNSFGRVVAIFFITVVILCISGLFGKANKLTYNSYDSYDDGYDDVYMDGDYDYDRYDRDSDYADGVDDAMDELGED